MALRRFKPGCCCGGGECVHFADAFDRALLGDDWVVIQDSPVIVNPGWLWFPESGVVVVNKNLEPPEITDWAIGVTVKQIDLVEYPPGSGIAVIVDNTYKLVYEFCDPDNYKYFSIRLLNIDPITGIGDLEFGGGEVAGGVDSGVSAIRTGDQDVTVGDSVTVRVCSLTFGQWAYEILTYHATFCGALAATCNSLIYGPVGLALTTTESSGHGGFFDDFFWDVGIPGVDACAPCGCFCDKSVSERLCMPDTLTATVYEDSNCPGLDGLEIGLTIDDEDKTTWRSEVDLNSCKFTLTLTCTSAVADGIECNFCLVAVLNSANYFSAEASPCPAGTCDGLTESGSKSSSTCIPLRLVFAMKGDGVQSGPSPPECCEGDPEHGYFHIEITE